METNEIKEAKRKIKQDIVEIINNSNQGMSCLCGHGESCENCTPSPKYNRLIKELQDYLSQI